ncbi:MAG TPA: hypothetical protein VMU27_02700 [Candidatus Paceibacterota bacterium]|nr:hypothetical protein [Candidatus Paceibacterota bacterium]
MPEQELTNQETDAILKERFDQLPKVVQDSINSADVQEHLRELATSHKLHVDQWQILENDVMLTLLGFQEPNDLTEHLRKDLDVDSETATILASDISRVVFDPIRKELERELDSPEADEKEVNAVESVGAQELASAQANEELAGEVQSATNVSVQPTPPAPIAPPPAPPETKAVRASISDAYKVGETSAARKDVHNDPYRESPV